MNAIRTARLLGPGVATGVLAATLALGSSAMADEPSSPRTATVSAEVSTLRNQKGHLFCRLYSSPAGFPEGRAGTRELRLAIHGPTARCTFEGVPAGTYAVSVMHDENANERLDKNFLGVPTEGYGASNNHTHALSAPGWDESKFGVASGKDVGLAIALRY